MNREVAIAKNRTKLLRLVMFWLVAAICLGRARKNLPPRIGAWVCAQLFKAEASVGYLIIACKNRRQKLSAAEEHFVNIARRHHAGMGAGQDGGQLYLSAIIKRLKAMRFALRGLIIRPQFTSFAKAVRDILVRAMGFYSTYSFTRKNQNGLLAQTIPP